MPAGTTLLVALLLGLACLASPALGTHVTISTGLVTGHGFTKCILRSSTRLVCWGKNNFGQLGVGDTQHYGTGTDPLASVPSAFRFGTTHGMKQVSLGLEHSCALFTHGGIRCWGRNNFGQLGTDSGVASIGANMIVMKALPFITFSDTMPATSISGGANFNCAVFSNGQMRCWGEGGRLGNGGTGNVGLNTGDMTSIDYVGWGTTHTIDEISCGFHHGCARFGGSVRCWGQNMEATLGYGNTNPIGEVTCPGAGSTCSATFLPFPGTDQVIQLAMGRLHSCALFNVTTGSGVRCWGRTKNGPGPGRGETGAGSYGGDLVSDTGGEMGSLPYINLPGFTAVQITVGNQVSCARSSSGDVMCWGLGPFLGQDGTADRGVDDPSMVGLSPIALSGTAVHVETYDRGTCVEFTDETVKCFGASNSGSLALDGADSTIGDATSEMGAIVPIAFNTSSGLYPTPSCGGGFVANNFQYEEQYANCLVVTGTLTFGITDASELIPSAITNVTGMVELHSTATLSNWNNLENLQEAQSIRVDGNSVVETIDLHSLDAITGSDGGRSLRIENCVNLATLSLPNLSQAEEDTFIRYNPVLSNFHIASEGSGFAQSMGQLFTIGDIPSTSWPDNLLPNGQGFTLELRSWPNAVNLSGLSAGPRSFHVFDMPLLQEIGTVSLPGTLHELILGNLPDLVSVSGLGDPFFTAIDGNIELVSLPRLASTGSLFDSVQSANGIRVSGTNMTSLSINSLHSLGGMLPAGDLSLDINNNQELHHLNIPDLRSAENSVHISNNPTLTSFDVSSDQVNPLTVNNGGIAVTHFSGNYWPVTSFWLAGGHYFLLQEVGTPIEVVLNLGTVAGGVWIASNPSLMSAEVNAVHVSSVNVTSNSQMRVVRGQHTNSAVHFQIRDNTWLEALRFPNVTTPVSPYFSNNPNLCCDDKVAAGGSGTDCRSDNCNKCPELYPAPQYIGPNCVLCPCTNNTFCPDITRSAEWANPACSCDPPPVPGNVLFFNESCDLAYVKWNDVSLGSGPSRHCGQASDVIYKVDVINVSDSSSVLWSMTVTSPEAEASALPSLAEVRVNVSSCFNGGPCSNAGSGAPYFVPEIYVSYPQQFSVDSVSPTSLNVSWTFFMDEFSCAREPNHISIEWYNATDFYNQTVPTTMSGSLLLTDLAVFSEYNVTVRVRTDDNLHNHTSRTVVTPGLPPSEPLNITASAITPNSFTLNWDAPTDPGTTPITAYRIRWNRGDPASYLDEEIGSVLGNITTFTVTTGIIPGFIYTVTVIGENLAGGLGLGASPVEVRAVQPPSPVNLAFAPVNASHTKVYWGQVTSGGGKIVSYNLYNTTGGSRTLIAASRPSIRLARVFIVGGFTPGESGTFCLETETTGGRSSCSSGQGIHESYTHDVAPGALTVTVSEVRQDQAAISWTPSNEPGVTTYTLQWSPNPNATSPSWVPVPFPNNVFEHSLTNLVAGKQYGVRVRAETTGQTGSFSPVVTFRACSFANPPEGILVLNMGAGPTTGGTPGQAVTWHAPPTTGGCPVTAFKVYRSSSPDLTNFTLAATVPSDSTTFYSAPLVDGNTYGYLVQAVTERGDGFQGQSFKLPYQAGVNNQIPRATMDWTVSRSGVTVTFPRYESDNGEPISVYKLFDGSTQVAESPTPTLTHPMSAMNITSDEPHTYYVQAISWTSSATYLGDPYVTHHARFPADVSDVSVSTAGDFEVVVNWTIPNSWGFNLTQCAILISDGSAHFKSKPVDQWERVLIAPDATGHTIGPGTASILAGHGKGLRSGITHYFSVSCENEFGWGLITTVKEIQPQGPAPGLYDGQLHLVGPVARDQLPHGYSASFSMNPWRVPPALHYNEAIAKVSVGSDFILAVTVNHVVMVSGSNSHGQLGVSPTDLSWSSEFVVISGVSGIVTDVRTSARTSYVLIDQRVWSWGDNNLGELGRSRDLKLDPTPARVDIAHGHEVTHIASSEDWAVAFTNMRTIVGWGRNTLRFDPHLSTTQAMDSPKILIAGGAFQEWFSGSMKTLNVDRATAGRAHLVVKFTNGALVTYGENTYGQSGTGKLSPFEPPTVITSLGDLKGPKDNVYHLDYIHDISSGADTTYVLTRNGIYAWGRNDQHQVTSSYSSDVNLPVVLKGGDWELPPLQEAKQVVPLLGTVVVVSHSGRVFTRSIHSAAQSSELLWRSSNHSRLVELYSGSFPELTEFILPSVAVGNHWKHGLAVIVDNTGPHCESDTPDLLRVTWPEQTAFTEFEVFWAWEWDPNNWNSLEVVNGSVHSSVLSGGPGNVKIFQVEGKLNDSSRYSKQTTCAYHAPECRGCIRLEPAGPTELNMSLVAYTPTDNCWNGQSYLELSAEDLAGICDQIGNTPRSFLLEYDGLARPDSLANRRALLVNETEATACPSGPDRYLVHSEIINCDSIGVMINADRVPAPDMAQDPCPGDCGTVPCGRLYPPEGAQAVCFDQMVSAGARSQPSPIAARLIGNGTISVSWLSYPNSNYTLHYGFDSGTAQTLSLGSVASATVHFIVGSSEFASIVVVDETGTQQFEGVTLDVRTPVTFTDLVSSSASNFCQVDLDGNSFCWGTNENQQLGLSDTSVVLGDEDNEIGLVLAPSPLNISRWGGASVKSISTSGAVTCAVMTNGYLFCWNKSTQLSGGLESLTPTTLFFSDDWKQAHVDSISLGQDIACIVSTEKRLGCWGDNRFGGLGLSSGNLYPLISPNASFPISPVGIPDTDNAWQSVHVSQVSSTVCGIARDNAYCWGQLGPNLVQGQNVNDTAALAFAGGVMASDPSGLESLNTGSTTVAITKTGHLVIQGAYSARMGVPESTLPVWNGDSRSGYLFEWDTADGPAPDGSFLAYGKPIEIQGSLLRTSQASVTTASPENATVCAVSSEGELYCWGSNTNHLLLGHSGATLGDQAGDMLGLTPVQLPGTTTSETFEDVTAGEESMCATSSYGRVFCWGHGVNGLDNTTLTNYSSNPSLLRTTDLPTLHGYPRSCRESRLLNPDPLKQDMHLVSLASEDGVRRRAFCIEHDGEVYERALVWPAGSPDRFGAILPFSSFIRDGLLDTNLGSFSYHDSHYSKGLSAEDGPSHTVGVARKWMFSKPVDGDTEGYIVYSTRNLFPDTSQDIPVDKACDLNNQNCVSNLIWRFCVDGYFPSSACDDPCDTSTGLKGQFGLCDPTAPSSPIDAVFGSIDGDSESKIWGSTSAPSRTKPVYVDIAA